MTKIKKNMATLLLVCLCSFFVTGCGNQIPDMTEEQNALVTEYAAGLLLKHHADYNGRLVDTSVPPQEKPSVEVPEVVVSENAMPEEETVEGTEISEEKGKPETVAMTPAQVLGVTGFDINYRGYEVCDSYPSDKTSAEELFFTMKAGAGNKLLALTVEVVNTSGQELELDTLSMTDLDCKILINNNDQQRAYVSMLDNDFMSIKRSFAPGEVYEAVIITEMPVEKAQAVTSVQLQLKNLGYETTLTSVN